MQELQGHGFTLAAIERYVAQIPDRATPEDIALHRTMLAPWHAQHPTRADPRRARPPGRPGPGRRRPRDARGPGRGDARSGSGRYDVAVSQLSVGVGLLDLGYPVEAARAAAKVYAEHGRAIAEELYEVFRTQVWPHYRESGASPERIQEVVERLKPLSIAGLVAAYEAGMDETRRANIARRSRWLSRCPSAGLDGRRPAARGGDAEPGVGVAVPAPAELGRPLADPERRHPAVVAARAGEHEALVLLEQSRDAG